MKENKAFFAALAAFTVASLFFINKAFHIDDPFTITIARAIGEHFIRIPRSYHNNPIFMGIVCDNPVLLGYYYAPLVKLFGEKEVWLHLFYLPFSLITIIAFYYLARRFVSRPLSAVLCFIVTPAFFVMSHNIMLDIPLLAFFVSALTLFIRGVDKDKKGLLFVSAILAGMASLTKYSGLLIIPLMFVYALFSSKKRYLLFLLIPLLMFFIWCLHNIIIYQRVYFVEGILLKIRDFTFHAVLMHTFAVLSFLSGTSISSIFLTPYLMRKRANRALLLFALPAGLCPFLVTSLFGNYGNPAKIALAALFIVSAFIILLVLKAGIAAFLRKPTDRTDLFLSFWFILVLVFTIGIQFVAARFLLLLLPPMFLIMIREAGWGKAGLPKPVTLGLVLTAILALVLAAADYRTANIYRDFPRTLKMNPLFPQKINFCSYSFDTGLCYGYAYYLRKNFPQEFNLTLKKEQAGPGDAIYVMPQGRFLSPCFYENCSGYCSLVDCSNELGRVVYKGRVFLHNRAVHAGFYSNDWGFLPFYISWGGSPKEVFRFYRWNATGHAQKQPPD